MFPCRRGSSIKHLFSSKLSDCCNFKSIVRTFQIFDSQEGNVEGCEHFFRQIMNILNVYNFSPLFLLLKGIDLQFELNGESTLIRSLLINWKLGE
jgi:hypothetical protein